MKRIFWILIGYVALAAGVVDASEQARGIVFEDSNRNLQRDNDEPGVAGVLVSNGQDVVRTNDAGEYTIGVEEGDIVFITKPRGYMNPVNEFNLPRFYYIHQPEGTPASLGFRYRGIDPTGPLPESIDFPLVPYDEEDDYNVIWFSDPQPESQAEIDYVRDDVVSELIGVDAAFGITTGDIVYDDLSLIPRQNAIIAQIGIQWHNVPGNHEINFYSRDDKHSRESYKRHFGPPYYSFEYGQVHYIVLNDVVYLGTSKDSEKPHPRGKGGYVGGIDDKQLEWLANDLALVPKDKLIVLAKHIPFRSDIAPEIKSRNVLNREKVFRILEDFPKVFSIAGHMHASSHNYFGTEDGYRGKHLLHEHVISTVSGSWWSGPMDERGVPVAIQPDGGPNGYYIMKVRGTNFTMQFKSASRSEDDQMRIVLDNAYHLTSQSNLYNYRVGQLLGSPIHIDQVFATQVIVNLFDGGPRSRVAYTIGDFDAVEMTRVFRKDPFIEEHFLRNKAERKAWIESVICEHLWEASLPPDLGPGTHTLTVQAVDEYGQTHVAQRVIEVLTN